jgi:hypothetical protein
MSRYVKVRGRKSLHIRVNTVTCTFTSDYGPPRLNRIEVGTNMAGTRYYGVIILYA